MMGEYGFKWVASIYNVSEEERYKVDSELKIPEEWNGHKVLRIAYGEYIDTCELVERSNDLEFQENELDKAIVFAATS